MEEEFDLMDFLVPLVGQLKDSDIPSPRKYQYWADRNQRVFYIDYEIDEGYELFELAKVIISINMEDMDKPVEELKPIKLFIMSYGGDLDQANFMCDLVKASRTPVYTIATGAAMSAGMLILLSGKKKYAFPHSQILVHQGSASFNGTASEIEEAQKAYRRQLDEMKAYILDNTTIDEKTFNKNRNKDWYLSAEECINYGVIDEVISDISVLV